ncbi:MAG: hypothetical protein ABJB33_06355 [Gemmatimonadota bacterium]
MKTPGGVLRTRSNWGMTAVALLAVLAARPVAGQAQQPRMFQGPVAAMVAVQVPAIIKVVVDPTTRTPDGSPMVRVITNIPALRAQMALGVVPEVVQQASPQYAEQGRSKGGEAVLTRNTEVDTGLVRYTIVQP